MAAPSARAAERAAGLRRRPEIRALGEDLVELPEIVEAHLAWAGAQRPRDLPLGHVAQQSVAEAPRGDPAQLLLDPFEHWRRAVHSRELQPHGKERRKPAHRARQVDALDDVFSAM